MTAAEFVAMCDRMSPDATLAIQADECGPHVASVSPGGVVLTPIGVERLGELLLDFENLVGH